MKARQVARHHGTEAPGSRKEAAPEVGMHELLCNSSGPPKHQTSKVMQKMWLYRT